DGIRRLRPGTAIREAGDADEPTERDQENEGPEDAYVMPGNGSLLSGHPALLPVTRSVDDGRPASYWTLVSIAARRRWTAPWPRRHPRCEDRLQLGSNTFIEMRTTTGCPPLTPPH